MGIISASVGFYTEKTGNSQFYKYRDDSDTTLYHEVTHQILGEYGTSNSTPIWVTEGVAVASETTKNTGKFDVEFKPENNYRLWTVKKNAPTRDIFDFMKIKYDGFHGSGRGTNYAFAGSLVIFFLTYEDGTYAEDFSDYLRDAYFNRIARKTIDKYIGKPKAELQAEFEKFIADLPENYWDHVKKNR